MASEAAQTREADSMTAARLMDADTLLRESLPFC